MQACLNVQAGHGMCFHVWVGLLLLPGLAVAAAAAAAAAARAGRPRTSKTWAGPPLGHHWAICCLFWVAEHREELAIAAVWLVSAVGHCLGVTK